jgi:hypothetical protein
MQTILFFLPGILYRLPDKFETLLDLGAGESAYVQKQRIKLILARLGPTVHVPIAVRKRAKHVFTSDYAKVF